MPSGSWQKAEVPEDNLKIRPISFYIESKKNIEFGLGDNSDFQWLGSGPNKVLLNEWTHVAATWDGSDMYLYINGVLVATQTQTIIPNTNNENFYIGSADATLFPWRGAIDEVSVWNTTITEGDIQNLMLNGLVGNEAGLVAYYDFNEGNPGADNTGVDVLPDLTSNGNDGNLSGDFVLNTGISNWVNSGSLENIPGEPVALSTFKVSETQIDLNWEDRSFNETEFAIFRSDGDNSSFVEIGTTGQDVTTYSDGTVSAESNYFYYVISRNANGDSAPLNEKAGATFASPGNALTFDGTDDFVEITDNNTLDLTTTGTIEAWIYPD